MNTQEQEFFSILRQCQKMHWIKSKEIKNVKIFYSGSGDFYQRGHIILNNEIILTPQEDDNIQYFRFEKQQTQDGFILEKNRYKNEVYELKYKYNYFKINDNCQGIHKKYEDNNLKQQIIHCKVEKQKTIITIIQHLKSQPNYQFFKFLRESIINYSSMEISKYFEKMSPQVELLLNDEEEELFNYVCNYNDTSEFQPKENDAKYVNDHYRLTQLDTEDQDAYYQLYQKVCEYKLSSNTIIRWLIARGFDIDASYTAIMNWIEWRRQYKINRLTAKSFPEFNGLLKIIGESKCGRQVVYTKQSLLQPEKIDLERYKWYFIGFLEDVCRSCKGYVDSYITVLDVEGFGFSNFDLQMTKSLLNMVLQYFPERQNKVIIVNMSNFVMGFYRMLKPFLPTRTNDKLIFCGKNKEEIENIFNEHLGFIIDFS